MLKNKGLNRPISLTRNWGQFISKPRGRQKSNQEMHSCLETSNRLLAFNCTRACRQMTDSIFLWCFKRYGPLASRELPTEKECEGAGLCYLAVSARCLCEGSSYHYTGITTRAPCICSLQSIRCLQSTGDWYERTNKGLLNQIGCGCMLW